MDRGIEIIIRIPHAIGTGCCEQMVASVPITVRDTKTAEILEQLITKALKEAGYEDCVGG